MDDQTLTEALASLGITHREMDRDDRSGFVGAWMHGIYDASGRFITAVDSDAGWAFVRGAQWAKSLAAQGHDIPPEAST